jgi:hypothetical protein
MQDNVGADTKRRQSPRRHHQTNALVYDVGCSSHQRKGLIAAEGSSRLREHFHEENPTRCFMLSRMQQITPRRSIAGKAWFLPQAIRAGDRKLRNVGLHKGVVVHAKFRAPGDMNAGTGLTN